MSAWFLGPKAENAEWERKMISHILEDYFHWRRNYFPADEMLITESIRREQVDFHDRLAQQLDEMLAGLRAHFPFYSPRYNAHMLSDQTIPAVLGYFAGLLYNPNNVTPESGPVTLKWELEVGADVLRDSARRLREMAPALRERIRDIAEPASVDSLMGGVRMFNPVIGAGNPIAPPLRIDRGEDGVVGWCTLGHAYEGPPMYGHGGVSAMLIDQLLGHAAAASGHPGVTTDLSVRYRRPVPLDVPLRVWGSRHPAGPAHFFRPAICASIGVIGGGMSAICMRSAIKAGS